MLRQRVTSPGGTTQAAIESLRSGRFSRAGGRRHRRGDAARARALGRQRAAGIMSLLLVRHGQASAGTANYDQLSERGKLQSSRLGQWLADDRTWLRCGGGRHHAPPSPDLSMRSPPPTPNADWPCPSRVFDSGWDEFDHHAVFDGFASAHPLHPTVVAAQQGGLQALGRDDPCRPQRLVGRPPRRRARELETFGGRVNDAAARLAAQGHQNALVLTSGGVISRLAQAALGASDRSAVDLNLSLRNSGLCEFHGRPYGLALGSWNALPHLHDSRELWTYY